ncbi:homeotic protein proboscipedia-like [Papaver somniferum]|nr:homeotic protein proboscipedia-like [Papaver somniferum]XP_026388366.1 homeotic protein proboscipedia-like [Papaver somniferum]XP_026388367.1 homeotic protein proboscipedia-like [Papaver somniferum]
MAVEEVEDTGMCKVKFLCSHGGKILPRPADGKLKYIGGETRLVVVPRNINFAELMTKLAGIFGGDTVLKYQLIPEDLDALVSVTNDDDLRYMLDEYDRHSRASESNEIPKLRAFLFPSDPTVIKSQIFPTNESYAIEQRYIDAINGVVHSSSTNRVRPCFSISSSCGSSPRSTGPDVFPSETISHDIFVSTGLRRDMHRVHSSPSDLCNLSRQHTDQQQQQHQHQHPHPPPPHPNPQHHRHFIEPPKGRSHHHQHYSSEQQPFHSHRHHYQQHPPPDLEEQHPHSNHHQHQHRHSIEQQCHQPHMTSRFHGQCNGGMSGQFLSSMSTGRSEISRPQIGHSKTRYYSPGRVQNAGCIGCGHVKECRICRNGRGF